MPVNNFKWYFHLTVVWFTVVTDRHGFLTIRKAKTPAEEMNVSFKYLKEETLKGLEDKKADLVRQANHLELNIQSLKILQEKDTGFLDVPHNRNLQ